MKFNDIKFVISICDLPLSIAHQTIDLTSQPAIVIVFCKLYSIALICDLDLDVKYKILCE